MLSPSLSTLSRALAAAVLLAACGGEPKPGVRAGTAAAAPAATPLPPAQASPGTATAGELPAGHAPVGALPPGHPPIGANTGGAASSFVPVDPVGGSGATGMSWAAPAGWTAEPPSNPMRRAQYRVGGPGGDGECAVFYFGPGQGGAPMENAQRWASQFAQPDGADPLGAMKTRTAEVGGVPVLFVETRGTYDPSAMSGGGAASRPGWALLGAVVQGADANWFFKLTGPAATVEAQKEAFDSLVGSIRRGG